MPKVNYTDAKGLFQETGTGIDLTSGTTSYRRKVIALSNAAAGVTRTLLAAESGAIVSIDPNSNNARVIKINLPTVSSGLQFDFYFTKVAQHNDADVVFNTAATGQNFIGTIFGEEASSANILEVTALNDVSSITLNMGNQSNEAKACLGTRLSCISDGTHWYFKMYTDIGVDHATIGATAVSLATGLI